MKVLAIGAHPDDVEIGCGGCLLKYAKTGNDVYISCMTLGEAGGNSAVREKEAQASAKIIGVRNLWFGGHEDTKLHPNGVLVNDIEEIINRVKPDVIFTHADTDEHHDHRAVGISTIEAARHYPRILAYEIPLTKNFHPQIFIDISDVIQKKVEALSVFVSQQGKQYLMRDAIYGLAQYRALQSRIPSTKFVEAFQVVKFVWNLI